MVFVILGWVLVICRVRRFVMVSAIVEKVRCFFCLNVYFVSGWFMNNGCFIFLW